MSSKLSNINRQLTSGKTRKGNGLDKIPGKREKLEGEKAAILAKMQEARDKRHDEHLTAIKEHTAEVGEQTIKNVNSHTTTDSDLIIEASLSLVGVNTQSPPDKIQMVAELASTSTSDGVLNSILTEEGMSAKGTNEEKAA